MNEVFFVSGITICFRLLYIITESVLQKVAWKWNHDKRRFFVVRIVSLTHATVSGICTLIGCYNYPNLWSDPYLFSCHYARFVTLFSMAYFIHDLMDMIIYGEAFRSKEYIFHHSLSLMGLLSILRSGRLLGLALICLLVEVQTIFIHTRTILQVLGCSRNNSCLYRVTMRCNLGSLVAFRHIPAIYLFFYIVFWEHRAPILLRTVLTCGLLFLVYHNFHLQYRFLKADGYLGDPVVGIDGEIMDPLDDHPKKNDSESNRDRQVG